MSNDNIDRIIGRLEEFHKHTAEKLEKIEKQLEQLNEFKWRIVGISTAVSFLVTIAVSAVKILK